MWAVIIPLAIVAAWLGRAVAEVPLNSKSSEGNIAGSAASTLSTDSGCVSVVQVTKTSALSTVTTTLTVASPFPSTKTNLTRHGTTTLQTSPASLRRASHGISANSTKTLVCLSGTAYSGPCTCLSISRSTVLVTADITTLTLTTTAAANGTRAPPYPANRTLAMGASSSPTSLSSSITRFSAVDQKTTTPETHTPAPAFSSSTSAPSSIGFETSFRRIMDGFPAMTPAFSNTTMESLRPSKSPVVYVLNATTLVTVTTPVRGSTSVPASLPKDTTTSGRYLNSAAQYTNTSSLTVTPLARNSTTVKLPPFGNLTTTPPAIHSATAHANPQTTLPAWLLNSTLPTYHHPTATLTHNRWLNLSSLPAINTTGTARWFNTSRYLNTSTPLTTPTPTSTSTSTPPPTFTSPTAACDPSNPGFSIRISQQNGPFHNWYLRTSGRGLLFTSQRSEASSFSVGPAGHLCVANDERFLDQHGMPYVAALGIKEAVEGGAGGAGGSSVWFVAAGAVGKRGSLEGYYTPLECAVGGGNGDGDEGGGSGGRGRLSCHGRSDDGDGGGDGVDEEQVRYWLGCGMQLDMSRDGSAVVPVRGLNCSSVALEVLEG